MTRILFAIPGDLSTRTGGYGYDRRVLQELRALGAEAVHLALPGGFPNPSAEDVSRSIEAVNRESRSGDVVLIDGLAYGALPQSAIARLAAPVVALCHHPLYLETGTPSERREALRESERRALMRAAHVICTSMHTRACLAHDLCAPAHRIAVAPPGTDPAARSHGSGGAPALLAVGSIIPRKAFDVLVEALAGLREIDWRLRIAGSLDHAPQTAAELRALIGDRGLQQRIELLGEVAEKPLRVLFDSSDVFVSSSLYEGYGMALAEALAHGLPIVATTGGAAAETVPDAAALKVCSGDVFPLREALRRVILDEDLRARLAEESWRAGQALPRWEETARIIMQVIQDVASAAR